MRAWVGIALAWLLAVTPAAAESCQRGLDPQLDKYFEAASAVFVARVISVEETTAVLPGSTQPQEAVRGRFRPLEVFKGAPPPDGTILTPVWREDNCGSFILAGSYFIFFLHNGTNITLRDDGSFMIWRGPGPDEPGFLQELRQLKK